VARPERYIGQGAGTGGLPLRHQGRHEAGPDGHQTQSGRPSPPRCYTRAAALGASRRALLLTDTFTFIHQPKTGGTFVTAMLTRLHEARGDRVSTVWFDPSHPTPLPQVAPGTLVKLMLTTRNQHGRRADIPAAHAGKPLLAAIRHPYDRYVSQYEFAWWRRYPEMFGPVDTVRRRFPAYPDLTFAAFVDLTNDVSVPYRSAQHPDDTPGFHTQQFVEYFFRDPESTWPRLDDPSAAATLAAEAHDGIRFLDQQQLNRDLAAFLDEMGYHPDEVAAVLDADRIWPPEGGRPADAAWAPYYPPDLKAFVRRKERWLFEWFPHFDV